jgi:hypothetical protein
MLDPLAIRGDKLIKQFRGIPPRLPVPRVSSFLLQELRQSLCVDVQALRAVLQRLPAVPLDQRVVRCFKDENVTHVSGKVSPRSDVEIIELELILSDLDQVDKRLQNLLKKKKSGDKEAMEQSA